MKPEVLLDITSATLATLLAVGASLRAKRALDRWSFAAGMLLLAAERLFGALGAQALSPAAAYRWQTWQLATGSLIPLSLLVFSLSYARGNAPEFIRRWRFLLLVSFLIPLLTQTVFAERVIVSTDVTPTGTVLVFRLGLAGLAGQLLALLLTVLTLVNLEHTYRSAVGTVRWRIKYILLGAGVLTVVRLFTATQLLLFRSVDPRLDILHAGALLLAALLILRSLFRTGHFNMDVHPSQAVLHGSVTILLVGIYLLAVGVLARVVAFLGGDSGFAGKALFVLMLLVLLALVLQSDRVRMGVRRFVSRHFQRPIHDYRAIWSRFTHEAASIADRTEYSRAVVRLVADIFETLSVSLWIVDERDERLALSASTVLSTAQGQELQPNARDTALILARLRDKSGPVDFESATGEWADALRRCHPDEFHKGGTRVCVPVIANREILAIILVGDRVAGAAFTPQDFDLLKSIGDQVSSGLLNVRLSQRLLQAREHEAFQTMATFFVHDLKNAASTLNLMLRNLPEHFDDPEFREDALRGMAKSVNHINTLISRLGELRSELKIVTQETDLNQVVRAAAASFPADRNFRIDLQLGELPALPVDRDQFGKVITNLILNAREACGENGLLKLATTRVGQWAVLEAADNGPGIPPEFLARSLFRPFQTTKKNGLGIGMFQSKMIIEAHGGRIAVESEPGRGATFRISLPLSPAFR